MANKQITHMTSTMQTHGLTFDATKYKSFIGMEWYFESNRFTMLERRDKKYIIRCTTSTGMRIKLHVNNFNLRRFGCPHTENYLLLPKPSIIMGH